MPRPLRIEYPGAIYHVMSRGDHREEIFRDDQDRRCFLKTLGEACAKADLQVHAWCLMPNHLHLVIETPNGNLAAGMQWLLGTYTNRFNRRHQLTGHLFSGRYKALIVDGSGNGYLKTVCDYVHLNPARAGILPASALLREFLWSSYPAYLSPPGQRPFFLRVDRLMGEHGIQADTPDSRSDFERRMEQRREEGSEPIDQINIKNIGSDPNSKWCIGSPEFKAHLLATVESTISPDHAALERRESSEAKAERIIGEELEKLGWTERSLLTVAKSNPCKIAVAARLRRETTMTLKWLAARLHCGAPNSLSAYLHQAQGSEPIHPQDNGQLDLLESVDPPVRTMPVEMYPSIIKNVNESRINELEPTSNENNI